MTPRTTIETHPTGTFFDFANPRAEDVHIEDIARSLSMQCRFGGFVSRFYSVAEHALLVSRLVREAGGDARQQFAALHHDSHEAYVGDIPTPLKNILRRSPEYDLIVDKIDEAIELAFDGIATCAFHADEVKDADMRALAIEASVLKVSRGCGPEWERLKPCEPCNRPYGAVACYESSYVEALFLAAHRRLAGEA